MRPQSSDYPPYFEPYVNLAPGSEAISSLSETLAQMADFLHAIPPAKANYAYAAGKWTIRQVLQHCIDAERIFACRALCHARGEQQSLPGFEQNDYAATATVDHRTLESLTEELIAVRKTSILLFENFTAEDLNRAGQVGGNQIKTFCWGFIITGHWLHHQKVLIEKYNIFN